MARMVNCIKLGREAEGLDLPPMPGEMGKKLWENVSKEAWQQWIKLQTMIINENRLSLADARARKWLAEQMEKHFFGDGADAARLRVPRHRDGEARRIVGGRRVRPRRRARARGHVVDLELHGPGVEPARRRRKGRRGGRAVQRNGGGRVRRVRLHLKGE